MVYTGRLHINLIWLLSVGFFIQSYGKRKDLWYTWNKNRLQGVLQMDSNEIFIKDIPAFFRRFKGSTKDGQGHRLSLIMVIGAVLRSLCLIRLWYRPTFTAGVSRAVWWSWRWGIKFSIFSQGQIISDLNCL